jgi:hypothetical protein
MFLLMLAAPYFGALTSLLVCLFWLLPNKSLVGASPILKRRLESTLVVSSSWCWPSYLVVGVFILAAPKKTLEVAPAILKRI